MSPRGGKRSGGRSASRGRSTNAKTSKTTTDHQLIQRWVEARGGSPACVKGTGGRGDEGVLRIDFPGYSGQDSLQHIDWCDWFEKFDESNLAFLYQDRTASGRRSNFNKLVNRSQSKSARHGRDAR